MKTIVCLYRIIVVVIISQLFVSCFWTKEPKQYTIGVSMYHNYSWREKLINEIFYASSRFPEMNIDTASAINNGALQAKQIRKMVDNGIKLLIVSPIPDTAVVAEVDRAYQLGIPVIVVDNKQILRRYTAFIGADNTNIGRQVGLYINNMLNGAGRIVEVKGSKDDLPSIERTNGFSEIISNNPNLKIVDSRNCNWEAKKSFAYMRELIRRNEKIDAIVFYSDGMVPDKDLLPKIHEVNPNVKLVSIDAVAKNPFGLQLVENNILEASFIYPTRGDLVIELASDILHGNKYEGETILPTGVVDKSNLQSIMQQHIEINNLDEQINHMKNDLINLRVVRKQQQHWVTFLLIVVFMGFIAIWIIYSQLRKNRTLRASIADKLKQEQKLSQELKESNEKLTLTNAQIAKEVEIKMNFFTNISHEIRTPLTLVQGPIQHIISDTSMSEMQRLDMLKMANNNLDQLCKISNEILDFQKLQNSKVTLKLVMFDIIKAINDWSDNFAQLEKEKQVKLIVPATTSVIWIEADRAKMTSIFVNLVGNAFKFTKPGGHITVKASVADLSEPELIMTVTDDGIGISAEDQPHIFESFFQSMTTNGGTGIGLAITKQFVEMHKGTISVESELGCGTTFTIKIPIPKEVLTRTIADSSCNMSESTETLLDENAMKLPTILLVEDNEEMRQYIKMLLKAKFNIIEAADGVEGLRLAQISVPDLIISDVMMPNMDGQELCKEVKSTIAISHIPIILLTARSLDEYRTEGYSSGADSYITKPFQASMLIERINNLLKNRLLLKNLFTKGSLEVPACLQRPRESEFLRRFRDYIDDNISDTDMSIESLASYMCVSRSQLHAKIKSLTGFSPIEQIRLARINKAKDMLVSSDISIQEICYSTGFTSPSYFTKCFRNETGMTPNEFRNKKHS